MKTPIHWGNIHEATSNLPICALPFYVYITAKNASIEYALHECYMSFIIDMRIPKVAQTEKLKEWCGQQATHYYECNH